MIGRILTKLFFRNEPAQGLVFALTLATVGTGMWVSLFLWLRLAGAIPSLLLPGWDDQVNRPLLILLIGILVLVIYSLTIFFHSLRRLAKLMCRNRNFRALRWGISASGCLLAGGFGAGLVMAAISNIVTIFEFDEYEPTHFSYTVVRACSPLPAHGVFFVSLLLLGTGYLLTAKFAAVCEQKKMRQCFGTATPTLWALALVSYVAALATAWNASAQTEAARLAAERRFNRPLTAAALETRYRQSGKIDGEFWKHFLEKQKELPVVIPENLFPNGWDFALPDRPSDELFAAFDRFRRQHSAVLSPLESGFDQVPPLPERKFVSGRLCEMLLPELAPLRSFCRLERSRVQSALHRRNLPEALAAYQRIKNCNSTLRKEPCLIGSLVWLSVENLRLDCVEMFLESRMLSEQQLLELDGELAALEQYIPLNHQQGMYSEAVLDQDVIYGLEAGKFPDFPVALAPFRWFVPQLWIFAAQDKGYMLNAYLAEDLTPMEIQGAPLKGHLLSAMLLPALNLAGNRFYALTARVRAARGLIRAEQYRVKHGEIPQTLPDLPLDPFSGTPLQYRVGETNISEMYWEDREVKTRIQTVRAVQVWSVGVNRRDENGFSEKASDAPDDVRAILFLP